MAYEVDRMAALHEHVGPIFVRLAPAASGTSGAGRPCGVTALDREDLAEPFSVTQVPRDAHRIGVSHHVPPLPDLAGATRRIHQPFRAFDRRGGRFLDEQVTARLQNGQADLLVYLGRT